MTASSPSQHTASSQDNIYAAAARGDINAIRAFIASGTDIDAGDTNGNTPLHIATLNNQMKAAQVLLILGANDELCNNNNLVAPDLFPGNPTKHYMHEYFVARGIGEWKKVRLNPFFEAAKEGDIEAIKLLIEIGEVQDIDIRNNDDYGMTALLYAAEEGRLEVLKYLISQGANINLSNQYGETALHLAANGDVKVVLALVEAGVDQGLKDINGNTFLDISSKKFTKKLTGSIREKRREKRTGKKIEEEEEEAITARRTEDRQKRRERRKGEEEKKEEEELPPTPRRPSSSTAPASEQGQEAARRLVEQVEEKEEEEQKESASR